MCLDVNLLAHLEHQAGRATGPLSRAICLPNGTSSRLIPAQDHVLGVLLDAKHHGLLRQIRPSLEALWLDADLYRSDRVCESTHELSGE